MPELWIAITANPSPTSILWDGVGREGQWVLSALCFHSPVHLVAWNDEFGQAQRPCTAYFLPRVERPWEVNMDPLRSEQLKIAENHVLCSEGLMSLPISTAPVIISSNSSLLLFPTAVLSGCGCTGMNTWKPKMSFTHGFTTWVWPWSLTLSCSLA